MPATVRDANPSINEIKSLTSLRGFAACMVTWGHSYLWFPAPTRVSLWVDLFFILSGFVICNAYKNKVESPRGFARFLIVRLGRIYPAHLATLLLAALAIAFVNHLNGKPLFFWRDTKEGLIHNLLLIQAWPPIGAYSWNMPSWSVSAEWGAYLLFPVLLIVSNRLRVWFVGPIILGWAAFYLHRNGTTFGSGADYGLYRCILGFSIGMWLASVSVNRLLYSDVAAICAAAAIAMLWVLPLSDWFVIAPMTLLIACLSGNTGICCRVLSWSPLHFVGRISYSLYLVHYPVYKVWQYYHDKVFPQGMSPYEMVAAAFVLSSLVVALAFALFELVEEPGRKGAKILAAKFLPVQGQVLRALHDGDTSAR